MVSFPTWIPHNPALLDLFISFDSTLNLPKKQIWMKGTTWHWNWKENVKIWEYYIYHGLLSQEWIDRRNWITLSITYLPRWCATGFANTWHYQPQDRVGLEFNCNILSCRLYWLKLRHPLPWNNIPYTALEPPNKICLLEPTSNTPKLQSKGLMFKTTGWLQGWLSFSSFQGQ